MSAAARARGTRSLCEAVDALSCSGEEDVGGRDGASLLLLQQLLLLLLLRRGPLVLGVV